MTERLKRSSPKSTPGVSASPTRQAPRPNAGEGQLPSSTLSPPVGASDPGAVQPAAWLAHLLQSVDSFYPTGSYAHSFGLEGLVNEGIVRDRDTLRQHLLLSALPALEWTELPLVGHAWHAFARPDWRIVGELSVLASALKTAREARLASENIGRQRAELAAALHPQSLATEYLREATARTWPYSAAVSAALEARVFGAPLEAALTGYAYAAIAAVVAAAMKLLRIGQNVGQSLIAEMLGHLERIIPHAVTMPRDEIGWFNPWLDIAAARHESADARMFIS
jgi:urease accessory protein